MLEAEDVEKWMSRNVSECSSDRELSALPRNGLNVYWKQGEICARNAVKPMCLMCA